MLEYTPDVAEAPMLEYAPDVVEAPMLENGVEITCPRSASIMTLIDVNILIFSFLLMECIVDRNYKYSYLV